MLFNFFVQRFDPVKIIEVASKTTIMYAVIQRVNALCGAVASLNAQVRSLNDQVLALTKVEEKPQVPSVAASVPNEDVAELKRLVQKVQLDVVDKNNDLKKDTKILETTLMLKVEQLVNKMVKDRHEALGNELKAYVDSSIAYPEPAYPEPAYPEPACDSNEDDYEINVTLTGEKDTEVGKIPKRKPRAKKPQ